MPKSIARAALAAAVLTMTGVPSMPAQAKQPTYAKSYAEDRAEIEDLMARYLFAIDYAENVRLISQPYDDKLEAWFEGPALYKLVKNRVMAPTLSHFPSAHS